MYISLYAVYFLTLLRTTAYIQQQLSSNNLNDDDRNKKGEM